MTLTVSQGFHQRLLRIDEDHSSMNANDPFTVSILPYRQAGTCFPRLTVFLVNKICNPYPFFSINTMLLAAFRNQILKSIRG
jgi:hypothetical protein